MTIAMAAPAWIPVLSGRLGRAYISQRFSFHEEPYYQRELWYYSRDRPAVFACAPTRSPSFSSRESAGAQIHHVTSPGATDGIS